MLTIEKLELVLHHLVTLTKTCSPGTGIKSEWGLRICKYLIPIKLLRIFSTSRCIASVMQFQTIFVISSKLSIDCTITSLVARKNNEIISFEY